MSSVYKKGDGNAEPERHLRGHAIRRRPAAIRGTAGRGRPHQAEAAHRQPRGQRVRHRLVKQAVRGVLHRIQRRLHEDDPGADWYGPVPRRRRQGSRRDRHPARRRAQVTVRRVRCYAAGADDCLPAVSTVREYRAGGRPGDADRGNRGGSLPVRLRRRRPQCAHHAALRRRPAAPASHAVSDASLTRSADGAGADFNRPPRLLLPQRATRLTLPTPPAPVERRPLPILMAVLPLVMGVAMAFFLHQVYLLAMAGLSPLLLIGSVLSERRYGKKSTAARQSEYAEHKARIKRDASAALKTERLARCEQCPSPDAVLSIAAGP